MNFNPTISLGDVISVALFIAAGFMAYNKLTIDLSILKTKVESLWKIHEVKVRRQHDGED